VTHPTVLEFAVFAAAVTTDVVAVVTLLVITCETQTIAATGRTCSLFTVGLEYATRTAAITNVEVVTVVTGFSSFGHPIATHGLTTRSTRLVANPAGLQCTVCGTTVAVVLIAIVTRLTSHDDAIPAYRAASCSGCRTGPTELDFTCGIATVFVFLVAIVTGFRSIDQRVAAHHPRNTRLTGCRACVVFLQSAALTAAIVGLVVAIVALFITSLPAIATYAGAFAVATGNATYEARLQFLAVGTAAIPRLFVCVITNFILVHSTVTARRFFRPTDQHLVFRCPWRAQRPGVGDRVGLQRDPIAFGLAFGAGDRRHESE
jgi:hypothetical protein